MSNMKSRGAGAAPKKYTWQSWVLGYSAWVLLTPLYVVFFLLGAVLRKLPPFLTTALLDWHERSCAARPNDVRIPFDPSIPAYMLRWWKIPRNAMMNVYFHHVLRSDDDRALHDHPWWSFSIVLQGGYFEHTISAGGVHNKEWFGPGSMKFRRAGKCAHRLELETKQQHVKRIVSEKKVRSLLLEPHEYLEELPAKTIFITGPVLRRWGFHAEKQWVDAYDWDDYCTEHGLGGMKMAGYAEQLNNAN